MPDKLSLTVVVMNLLITDCWRNHTGNAGSSPAQATLPEENSKLREALRRLHFQSTTDKSQLDALKLKSDNSEKELITLREYQTRTAIEILELQEAVDDAAAYETIVETLTEQNLELAQSKQELDTAVRLDAL